MYIHPQFLLNDDAEADSPSRARAFSEFEFLNFSGCPAGSHFLGAPRAACFIQELKSINSESADRIPDVIHFNIT